MKKTFKKYLESYTTDNKLYQYVKDYLLNYSDVNDDIISHAEDIAHYGGQSGCISWHIYTRDNKDFVQLYLDEIMDEYTAQCEMSGEHIRDTEKIGYADFFAWFAIEEVVRNYLAWYGD